MPLRPFALVRTKDQWSRAAHDGTAIDAETGGVSLAWELPGATGAGEPTIAGGLAFDAECRLYRSAVDEGQVQRLRAADVDPFALGEPEPVELFSAPDTGPLGQFAPVTPATGPLREPRGLAVDCDDRLFVAESGAGAILVHDLWSRRLIRRVATGTAAWPHRRPMDLASSGRVVWALLADVPALLRLEARSGPIDVPLLKPAATVPAGAVPVRVATSLTGEVFLLFRDPAGVGWVASRHQAGVVDVAGATDLEFDGEGRLVVAGLPSDPLRVFARDDEAWTEAAPLNGWGYDGMGIVRTPTGDIGFWTADGDFRVAYPARVRFERRGTVTTYLLDAGEYQTRWGRLFVDACVPDGTSVRVRFATADELGDEPTIVRTPPSNVDAVIPRPDLSPPMVFVSLVPPEDEGFHPVHRRETGREVPWARPDGNDPFETYETPVLADPGRFLWVTLELGGNTRLTPRVKSVRVEHPMYDNLRRLPRAYSRDDHMAEFLRWYLAMLDGELQDLDVRAEERRVLLDPRSAPEEILPWLAGFVGLALDLRWPLDARRTFVAEAVWLFRYRGTVRGLARMLEIYLGRNVIIVERFRLRGLGGTLLGRAPATSFSRSVVGAGFRVGGAVGDLEENPLSGSVPDAFATHAHRFAVIVPLLLSAEQLDVVTHLLEVHRPAHTVFDVCTVGAGMRVGHGLHLGLSSMIGRTAGFSTLQLGDTLLGRGSIVGRPESGTVVGNSHLGGTSRVG